MAGTTGRRHPQDASRINIHEDWELRFWSDKWGIPRSQLIDTIKRVGVRVKDVAKALGKGE